MTNKSDNSHLNKNLKLIMPQLISKALVEKPFNQKIITYTKTLVTSLKLFTHSIHQGHVQAY